MMNSNTNMNTQEGKKIMDVEIASLGNVKIVLRASVSNIVTSNEIWAVKTWQ